jgi:hypothetical protein
LYVGYYGAKYAAEPLCIFFHPDYNRRCLNFTGSAGKTPVRGLTEKLPLTAGGEFHSAPKTTSNIIILRNFYLSIFYFYIFFFRVLRYALVSSLTLKLSRDF